MVSGCICPCGKEFRVEGNTEQCRRIQLSWRIRLNSAGSPSCPECQRKRGWESHENRLAREKLWDDIKVMAQEKFGVKILIPVDLLDILSGKKKLKK